MARYNPDTTDEIDFNHYRFNDKSRPFLKNYKWGTRAKTGNLRRNLARQYNSYTRSYSDDKVKGVNFQWARIGYLNKVQPSVKKKDSKPVVKGGLGSSKKKDPPVEELKQIMAKESVKEVPKEIKRQTVFQPRGKRKQIRNPFTGNRPTL